MIQWNRVTWYSKLLALVLFVIVIPLLGFYLGMQYAEVKETAYTPYRLNPSFQRSFGTK